VQQHVLDDGISPLAVLNHLFEVATDGSDQLFRLFALGALERRGLELVDELARQQKLLTKFSGFLISWAIPAGELAEGSELFRLDQAILRLAQVVERSGELPRARLHLVEQANVFHSDDGLIGESLHDSI